MSDQKKTSAVVALIGAPNAGKSTLVNKLVGAKISIVTPKVQTTRARVAGIVINPPAQIVFVDTPGIFKPSGNLDKAMVSAAHESACDADFTVTIVDAKRGICENTERIIKFVKDTGGKNILVLNKIDIVKKHSLLELATKINSYDVFCQIFMLSALNGDGVCDLKNYFRDNANEQPWIYPEDQISDMPLRAFASEITREKLLFILQQELPYKLAVETENFEEGKNSIKINQVIYTRNENHKKIIVGKGGSTIREIGEKSRKELGKIFGKKVHLFLFVKVCAKELERQLSSVTGKIK